MKHGYRWPVGALVVIALVAMLGLIAPGGHSSLAADGIIYVDVDATGLDDGSSWDNAYTDLQSALDAAPGSGDQIWVAAGTYIPTVEYAGSGDRFRSFQMKNGVAIYGGFDPSVGATAWQDRDWGVYQTILSGDLNGDDVPPFTNTDENAYHVFYHPEGTNLDDTAILDGFTIASGNANVAYPHNHGGGMYNDGSSPALINCTFAANFAQYGGNGGGVSNEHSTPVLTNCTFKDNHAYSGGGGMYNNDSSPTLTNCTFEGNVGGTESGGMYNYDSAPVLTNCTFEGNSAGMGGGMYNWHSAPVLTNCTFEGNWGIDGGGMANHSDSSPTLTNCTFESNSADEIFGVGGGMFNQESSPTLTNCTFEGNSAPAGGGMYNYSSASPTLINCILWGDSPDEIHGADPDVTYSNIEGGYTGTGNINSDPLFMDPANGDFHLGPGSPCIDTGDNTAPHLPPHDFEGHTRIMDGDGNGTAIVDMGVDEAFGYHAYLPIVLRGH